MTDILIIGAGPAGLTSAIYALRAGLSVTILDKFMYGGQVAISDKIENYPGFKEITGYELSVKLYEQVVQLGAEVKFDEVVKVKLDSKIKHVITDQEDCTAKSVIIASGAKRKKLGCPGEKDLTGKGVSYCATCDGAFFKGKDVIVVGGGNTALEDAIYLSAICKKVILIHRKNNFRAEKFLVDSILQRNNIEIKYECIVQEINGQNKVTSATIKNLVEKQTYNIDTSAVFISIGTEPDIGFVKDILPTDQNGYIIASEDCVCPIPGIFIAGDCRTKPLRQIVTATSDGAVAAFQAINYINTRDASNSI